MSNEVNQTVSTRNQSTANYQTKKVFIWDNHYKETEIRNNTGANHTVVTGQLVMRDPQGNQGTMVIPIVSGEELSANLAKVIGITKIEDSVEMTNGMLMTINIGTKGTIDGNALTLPAGVTLNTMVGDKTLGDVLEGIGFHVDTSTVEHTDFDN